MISDYILFCKLQAQELELTSEIKNTSKASEMNPDSIMSQNANQISNSDFWCGRKST